MPDLSPCSCPLAPLIIPPLKFNLLSCRLLLLVCTGLGPGKARGILKGSRRASGDGVCALMVLSQGCRMRSKWTTARLFQGENKKGIKKGILDRDVSKVEAARSEACTEREGKLRRKTIVKASVARPTGKQTQTLNM